MDPILSHILLLGAGIFAGFVNVMAGGGSIVPLGIMCMFGVDATVANATNRPGIFAASLSSTRIFINEKKINRREALVLGLCAIPGSIAGALFALKIDSTVFEKILGVTMLFVAGSLFLPLSKKSSERNSPLIYPVSALIGFYGGFIQLGVGFILMAAFKYLQNLPLVEVNARKMAITLLFTIPALIIFIVSGKIMWSYAIVIAIGNLLGAHISAKIAIKKGDKIVKVILACMTIVMVVELFRK